MTHTHLRLQTIHGHLNGEDILHRGLHAHQDHLQGQQDQEHTQGHLHVLHIGKKTFDLLRCSFRDSRTGNDRSAY